MNDLQRQRIRAAVGAIEDRGESWAASIPASFGPKDGARAAAAAYTDARAAVRKIADSYRGTVPPPPWPAPPALQESMRRIRVMRDGFEALQRRGASAQRWRRDSGKVGPALVREGRAMYRELGQLVKVAASKPKLEDVLKYLPDPRGFALLVAFGVGLYLLSRESRPTTRIDGREFA